MEKLIKILNEVRPDVNFEKEHSLIDKGILDSFDIISIVGLLSDAYGIEIPVEEIDPDNFNSAESIHKMLERLQEE